MIESVMMNWDSEVVRVYEKIFAGVLVGVKTSFKYRANCKQDMIP